MQHGYEEFCLADPVFYDSYTVTRGDDVDLPFAQQPVPGGWERRVSDDWLIYWPDGARVPPQGWKIHASACLDNAEEILAAVVDYCLPRRIPFKFVRSLQCLLLRNSKYADRAASGKFVTIYPADDAQFTTILDELGRVVAGQPGPYILSDLRWGDGPLYVRYGGFAERHCLGPTGALELAIVGPDGQLLPDHRGPTFSPPAWVPLPACLEPHLAARANQSMEDLPYRIERALHFSNGGGLYLGVDERTGEQVVFKEARPYAGLDTDRTDAVTRLLRERDTLRRLAGLEAVPGVRDHFVVSGHHFLVLDYVEGDPLAGEIVLRYPLTTHEVDPGRLSGYADWVFGVVDRLEQAVGAIHERGVVVGDLHPSNVLVRPDGSVVLVDFEVAWDVADQRRPTLADPAFMAPRTVTGVDIDHYALACLRLFLFLPLTALFCVDPRKATLLAAEIGRIFPVPDGYLADAVARITGQFDAAAAPPAPDLSVLAPDRSSWERARRSMAAAVVASATPARRDRLFPGDPRQFATGGLNLAHGAAGVLYALAQTGAARHEALEDWLVERAVHPDEGSRLGFYDGLHGVAYVLDHLGHHSEAAKVLDICTEELRGRWDRLGLDLLGGLSGIGLNLAHFAARYDDPSLRELAWAVAERVADRLGDEESVPTTSGGAHPYAGLLRGSSGPALLFVRLYEQFGEGAFLDLALTALRQDLRRCVRLDEGMLHVDEDWRTMPYIADGSVGIGMVVDDVLAHRHDDRLAAAAPAIRRAAEGGFYIEPGLFYGRAGMILYLSRGRPPGTAGDDPVVARHVRRLAWHGLGYQGQLAFPGEQLLRLSMDLATGTAGVLLALGAALHDQPVHLPFLPPAGQGTRADGPLSLPACERR